MLSATVFVRACLLLLAFSIFFHIIVALRSNGWIGFGALLLDKPYLERLVEMWPQLLVILGVFLVNDLNALDIAHLNSLFGLRLLAHVVNTVARAVLERLGHFAIISKSRVLEAKDPLVGAPAVV